MPRVMQDRLAGDVVKLAAEAMEGRAPGSEGERRAADLLISELASVGAEPLGELGAFRDPFELTAPVLRGLPQATLATSPLEFLADFTVNVQGAASGGVCAAELVWVGAPDLGQPGPAWLATRAALFPALPTAGDPRASLERYLERVRWARDAGACAAVFSSPRARMRKVMCHRHESPGIPCLDVAPLVLSRAWPELARAPSPGSVGPELALDVPLAFAATHSAGNVIATLGRGKVGLVLCAHYDHVGALPDGRWFPGALDNASGVAVLLELARQLAARPLAGRLVLLFSSGEEVGLVGTRRFVSHLGWLLDETTPVIDVDEIGGAVGEPLDLLGTAAFWARVPAAPGFRCAAGGPGLPGFSDHRSFLEGGFPAVATLVGAGRELDVLHTLEDRPERIDPARLANAAATLRALVDRIIPGAAA